MPSGRTAAGYLSKHAGTCTAARKVVFSRTLKTADWANTTIAAGDTVSSTTLSNGTLELEYRRHR